MEKSSGQVGEATAAAEKAQKLFQNVATRKKNKQLETGGLVIVRAVYGNKKLLRKGWKQEKLMMNWPHNCLILLYIPLNFLVNDAGQIKLHEGTKKSGIMGFYDPCPGETKKLQVEYTYRGQKYEVIMVDDYDMNF